MCIRDRRNTLNQETHKVKTLLFYTHALTGGGAERVLAVLASGYARRGERVLFLSLIHI